MDGAGLLLLEEGRRKEMCLPVEWRWDVLGRFYRNRVEDKEKDRERDRSELPFHLARFNVQDRIPVLVVVSPATAASAWRQHLAVQRLLPMDKHCPSGACSHHVLAWSGSHPSSVSVSLSSSRVVSIVADWFWLVQTRLEMYPQWAPQSMFSWYNWRSTTPHGLSHDVHSHTKRLQQWTK